MTKKKNGASPAVHKGDAHYRAQEIMPSYAVDMMEDIIGDSKRSMFREQVAWAMLRKDPSLSKHLINKTPVSNKIFKFKILEKIKKDMPMSKQRKLFESATISLKGCVEINLNKITGTRRRIDRKNRKLTITSNTHDGMKHMKNTNLQDIAKKMYDILKYNSSQGNVFNDHATIFGKKCDDKSLVRRVRNYSKTAMDMNILPGLRDDVKVYTGTA